MQKTGTENNNKQMQKRQVNKQAFAIHRRSSRPKSNVSPAEFLKIKLEELNLMQKQIQKKIEKCKKGK